MGKKGRKIVEVDINELLELLKKALTKQITKLSWPIQASILNQTAPLTGRRRSGSHAARMTFSRDHRIKLRG